MSGGDLRELSRVAAVERFNRVSVGAPCACPGPVGPIHVNRSLQPPSLMKNRTSTHESTDAVIENLRSLIAEAEKILNEGAAEPASEALADLKGRLEDARHRAEELYQDARQKVVAGARQADETIRAHPYESLAIALGVGVLLGALLRRN
jgi:ElaB/YqjD/DUF883 family membrane-anchored ribosome-binding protein